MNSERGKEVENPLIWPLLTILQASKKSYKVHHLASELQIKGLLPDLDNDANKALFKRNFLLMNALYQLQDLLFPEHYLQIDMMDIQIFTQLPTALAPILKQQSALRHYYFDWGNFETSSEDVEEMFSSFWQRYQQHIGKSEHFHDRESALKIFELDSCASSQDIRRQWRKLALKWHPDRANGNAVKFKEVCVAWQQLRC